MDLDLTIVSDDDFQCYNTAEQKPVLSNVDVELQLRPDETTLTPDTGIKIEKNQSAEPQQILRSSQRVPFAEQTQKLGGVPYYTENNKKKTNNICVLQESPSNQPEAIIREQSINRNIRTQLEKRCDIRKKRNYNQKPPQKIDLIQGNVMCTGQAVNHRHNL